eukprot:GHRR01023539.1.p1 GENE.GHRR01023539.1~~GHRR01023539.1.p1  ORF type:complete len:204 (+),score=70.87 GHRR01023539.1:208-819(+)
MPSAAQSTVSLPVPPCVRHALMSAGLSSVADIRGMSEDALQTVAGLSQQQAADVHQFVAAQPSLGWRLSGATSAAALLQESTEQLALSTTGSFSTNSCTKAPRRISTGSAALDSLLGGGGVDCGTVTEFCKCACCYQQHAVPGTLHSAPCFLAAHGKHITNAINANTSSCMSACTPFAASSNQRLHDFSQPNGSCLQLLPSSE